ncbi:hypothetical protein ANO11243_011530 [Dothideomycetidae sp. 11243]|nr:hypothetical protein ANO11243_011530 [fungal sp. No.11243]
MSQPSTTAAGSASAEPTHATSVSRAAEPPVTTPAALPAEAAPAAEPIANATNDPQVAWHQDFRTGDRHWIAKIILRAILVLVGIIGIGCAAAVVAKFGGEEDSPFYGWDVESFITWTLITFAVSVVWCAICILIFVLRKPHTPVHPGAQVGCDLVLWLAFIATALFAVVAVINVSQFGEGGIIQDYSSNGFYYLDGANNTWIWNSTADSSGGVSLSDPPSSDTRDCDNGNNYYNEYQYFTSCAEEDAYVNNLWKEKPQRYNLELTVTVCQFISLIGHFALFVWACVDTARRNNTRRGATDNEHAQRMAADIVSKLFESGVIVAAPGRAHVAPDGTTQYAHQQYAPGPHQQYASGPHQQYAPGPHQSVVASGSNEKSAVRYA